MERPLLTLKQSGVSWDDPKSQFTVPPGEEDLNCARFINAYSPVVNSSYEHWMPPGKTPKFAFEACSGARSDLTAEFGGNNLDFYPLADACLFHRQWDKDYGKTYTEDTETDPEKMGACRHEFWWEEVNKLIWDTNRAIEYAVNAYSDSSIQFIDIDGAFDGHRFCETKRSGLWNRPARWLITVGKEGGTLNHYNRPGDTLSGEDQAIYDIMTNSGNYPSKNGDNATLHFVSFQYPDLILEFSTKMADDIVTDTSFPGGGQIARTLHPQPKDHKAMADIIFDRLAQDFHFPPTPSHPIPVPVSAPAPAPSKAIGVVIEYFGMPGQDQAPPSVSPSWVLFQTTLGKSEVCGNNGATEISRVKINPDTIDMNNALENPPWPGGSFDIDVEDEGAYQFLCDGSNAGTLWCRGQLLTSCRGDPNKGRGSTQCGNRDDGKAKQQAVVICEY
ncbi:hypothetical protein BDV96DRAFT_670960 [Lophiotrema nucula]|uniref:Uncharacterized protein n=1 Tax=Lophiotrema nucula TaxID=690887 RepID=A0A6A5YN08_9PLEO|nr:hypothetical protein BDV96DRAFT_670960 [Lophiotrema nucula]